VAIKSLGTHADTTKTCTPRGPSEVLFLCPRCRGGITHYPCSRYDASKGGPCGYKPGSFDAEEKERRRLEREYRKQLKMQPGETAVEYLHRLLQWLKDNNYKPVEEAK